MSQNWSYVAILTLKIQYIIFEGFLDDTKSKEYEIELSFIVCSLIRFKLIHILKICGFFRQFYLDGIKGMNNNSGYLSWKDTSKAKIFFSLVSN